MTTGLPSPAALEPAQVAELLHTVAKALRTFQMYLPNNPIHQRAVQGVRSALAGLWSGTDELVLSVGEAEFRWEEEVVYSQPNKAESLSWLLYKDGMRILTLKRGAEEEEFVRFLDVINRARFLPADASDDLLTLLWEQEFERIAYHFIDFFGEGESLEGSVRTIGGGETAPPATADERRAQVQEEAPPRPKGIVDIDDFDSTLYFLEEAEINYVADEVQKEYRRDVRQMALHALFDLYETQPDPAVRAEIGQILDILFPNLLNKGEFRTVAMVMREMRLIASRAPALTDEQRKRLQDFEAQLSQPAIVAQLVQALDEAGVSSSDADVTEVLRELRATALGTLVAAVPRLANAQIRAALQETVDRLATQYPAEVMRLLREPADATALASTIALCGRLQLQQAVAGLGETVTHADPAVRLASVQALGEIASPGALTHIDRAIEDPDRTVRITAVRLLGSRGYKGALRRVEAVVLGKNLKDLDLTEKMAFFEAYGSIAGPAALKTLEGILLPRGLLKLKEPPETRACAAMALGKIRSPEARQLLTRAADDKELVVRNAVNRALRDIPA